LDVFLLTAGAVDFCSAFQDFLGRGQTIGNSIIHLFEVISARLAFFCFIPKTLAWELRRKKNLVSAGYTLLLRVVPPCPVGQSPVLAS